MINPKNLLTLVCVEPPKTSIFKKIGKILLIAIAWFLSMLLIGYLIHLFGYSWKDTFTISYPVVFMGSILSAIKIIEAATE